ncbi:MAG: glutamate 5-kinase [Phycisphaeraceae bacterium]
MPSTPLRQNVLSQARSIVVKLGTQLLARRDAPDAPDGQRGLDRAYCQAMAAQMVALRARGMQLTIVSSGAIGAGVMELNLPRRPVDVAEQQAAAAVGQRRLMDAWHEAFAAHGVSVGQLLLTRADFDDRQRFLNIRNCVSRLHQWNCIPVLNENDTVSTEELGFGDNDMLAALMTHALRANVLVILSVVDGLLDASGQRIDLVTDIDEATGHARHEKSALGTGGMNSKLEAVRLVMEAGELAVIANGREPDVLTRLFDATTCGVGTIFAPSPRKLDSRRRWIGLTKRPAGVMTVDAGAARALTQGGKSLLASGIVKVDGEFDPGDVVLVRDDHGQELARGLSNYSAQEARLIMGRKSSQFQQILGRPGHAEVLHRDNLVLTGR